MTLKVTQGHRHWHCSIGCTLLTISALLVVYGTNFYEILYYWQKITNFNLPYLISRLCFR